MNVSIESPADGVTVMTVSGDIDVFVASEFKERLFACLDHEGRRLIVDMSGAGDIDSTGRGVLAAGVKRARGRALSIVCDEGALRRVIGIVGLDRVCALYRTRGEALDGAAVSPTALIHSS